MEPLMPIKNLYIIFLMVYINIYRIHFFLQTFNPHCKTVPMKLLLFFSCFVLLQKEHPQWIQHVVSAPPDLWLLLDNVTVGSPFGFSAALVSVSAVPSNSSHNSVSSSALLQNLWIISIWELLTCNKMPGMCQCDTPEEAIRSTIHLHIPLP